jgi:hypothetical protein
VERKRTGLKITGVIALMVLASACMTVGLWFLPQIGTGTSWLISRFLPAPTPAPGTYAGFPYPVATATSAFPPALPSAPVTRVPINPIATRQAQLAEATKAVVAMQTQQALPTPSMGIIPSPTAGPISTPLPNGAAIGYISSDGALVGPPPLNVEFTGDFNVAIGDDCKDIYWDWGDGTTTPESCSPSPVLPPKGTFTATHTYTQTGAYMVSLNVVQLDNSQLSTHPTRVTVGLIPGNSASFRNNFSWGLLLAVSLIATGAAIVLLARYGGRWKGPGYAVVVLALMNFVQPFSFLPNPLGLFWQACGCYSYDPRLPFRNGFVVAGQPESLLAERLNGLIGETGLDPLDVTQPLAGYEFLSVSIPGSGYERPDAVVTTRMLYQDGSTRDYLIPVWESQGLFGMYRFLRSSHYSNIQVAPLDRLSTIHEPLAEAPPPRGDEPLILARPVRIQVHPESERLMSLDLGNWSLSWGAYRPVVQPLISPQGDAVLLNRWVADKEEELWLVPLNTNAPRKVAENVADYAWSPDGNYIVYTQAKTGAAYSVGRNDGTTRKLTDAPAPMPARDGNPRPLGVSSEGLWYIDLEALHIKPFDGSQEQKLPRPVDANSGYDVQPSPDGRRIAFRCEGGVCLQDRNGKNPVKNHSEWGQAVWNNAGSELAVAWQNGSGTTMYRVTREGLVTTVTGAQSGHGSGFPQWTPDGKYILLQTTPFYGRRIIAFDLAGGRRWELSQPRWDTWSSLSPDGKYVLLTNGRGGFWRSDVVIRKTGGG